ncbi:hypothetical protein ACJX0J_007339, partial [Zea mays]
MYLIQNPTLHHHLCFLLRKRKISKSKNDVFFLNVSHYLGHLRIISPIQDEFLFYCYSMHLLVIGLVTDATNTWFLIIEFNEVFASEGGIGKIIDYIGKLAFISGH